MGSAGGNAYDAKYQREDNYLDYRKLFSDGLLKINPKYPFATLDHYRLGDRTAAELCTYHGQVDPTTRKPNGVGIAITELGHIHEGYFEQGQKKYPYLQT